MSVEDDIARIERELGRLDGIESDIERIESKLDKLIAALAEEDEEQPSLTLDGHPAGGERDPRQGL